MDDELLSVEQVAERLGLHVRTVRGYIRDGRLKAVRIGKQYRIARADLDTLTGRPVGGEGRRPRVEASTVVEIDSIGASVADRLSTLIVAGAQLEPVRVRTIYDEGRSRLKVIVLGSAGDTATVLQTISDAIEAEDAMLLTDEGECT